MRIVNEPTSWGTSIKERREALGKSVPESAAAVGVHPATWYYWENGEHAPHRDTMLKVADLLEAEPCELFFPGRCGRAA